MYLPGMNSLQILFLGFIKKKTALCVYGEYVKRQIKH